MKAKVVFLLMFATVILTDAAKLLTSQDGYERIVVSRSEPLHLYAPGCIFEKNRKDSLYARFYIVDERLPNGVDGIDAIRVTIYHEYAAGYPLKLKMGENSQLDVMEKILRTFMYGRFSMIPFRIMNMLRLYGKSLNMCVELCLMIIKVRRLANFGNVSYLSIKRFGSIGGYSLPDMRYFPLPMK